MGKRGFCCLLASLVLQGVIASASPQEAVMLRHRWEIDPDVGMNLLPQHPPKVYDVDVERLNSRIHQHRISEAKEAVQHALTGTITNRRQAFEAALTQLQAGEPNRQIEQAMLSAAIEMAGDLKDVANVWDILGDNENLRQIVEPKLVQWKSDAALELWRTRLSEFVSNLKQGSDQNQVLIAVEGIAAVGNESDRPLLESLLGSERTLMPVKFAASKALGSLVDSGLESLARKTLDSGVAHAELNAANLLARHSSDLAEQMLVEILESTSAPAHGVAYYALAAKFPEKARELADQMIQHPDNQVRRVAIQVADANEDRASLELQASALADRNVGVRRLVRENLSRKAQKPQWKPVVDKAIDGHLAGERFEGVEQAILLAVALKENERAKTFIQLLEHPRIEVNIRAAWALQAIELEPDSLAEIFEICKVTTQRLVDKQRVEFPEEARTAFLFEAIGRHAYEPAYETLLLYVPKQDQQMRQQIRAAAIYALGYICADQEQAKLVRDLGQRMNDNNPNDPESMLVKYACAIALGRIGNRDCIPDLQRANDDYPLTLGTEWSLNRFGVER